MAEGLERTSERNGMDTLNDLDKLAQKYGADKWGKHHYTPVYYDLFKDRRNEVKKILEIGVAEGASLFMWRDFFPNARINGADNDFKRVIALANKEPIRVYPCDQSNYKDLDDLLKETGTDIDLFVDDGSHIPSHQARTCLHVFPQLKKGAIYIIEDIANESIMVDFPSDWNCKLLRVGSRYDDRLIICQK